MGDILKEAIADAKAVRETALQNAKMALEEAFTPQLKSMLSAKLKEDEFDDEGEPEEGYHEDDEEGEAEEGAHEEGHYEDEEIGDDEPEVEEEGIIEIDGVKYAPVVSEDEVQEGEHEDEDDEAEEGMHEEENLDLEAVIKELESELSEGEDEEVTESDESVEESKEETVDESDESVEESKEETVEEEYEIDESVFTEGEHEDEDDEVEESTDNTSALESELKEYKEAVVFLKDKLHEVNILNAKLLFTNKLFKEYALDNNQKLKVVETFDRAQTTREIKLVYSTLAEQFGDNGSIVTKKSISESASSAVASTKPSKESRKVISEENQVANRFKKLAGLL
jgi:hypothetical protein